MMKIALIIIKATCEPQIQLLSLAAPKQKDAIITPNPLGCSVLPKMSTRTCNDLLCALWNRSQAGYTFFSCRLHFKGLLATVLLVEEFPDLQGDEQLPLKRTGNLNSGKQIRL